MASGVVGRILVDCGEPVRAEASPQHESTEEPASLPAPEPAARNRRRTIVLLAVAAAAALALYLVNRSQ